jgi:hypothetical protein
MCSLKILPVVLVLSTLALATTAKPLTSPDEVAAKMVAHEQAEVQLLGQYTPLVQTYIQYLRADNQAGSVPHGDKYFLGRAELAQGTRLEPLDRTIGMNQKLFGGWTKAPTELSTESNGKTSTSVIAALPLGGRSKIDPWNDQLRMLKSKPPVAIAESEKMLFQITHFLFYLTHQADNSASEDPGAVATKLPSGSKP